MQRVVAWMFVVVVAVVVISGLACEPAAPFVPIPSKIVVTPDSRVITALRYTEQFTATAIDQRGATIANARFQWLSSNSRVATVNDHGLVTAVGPGVATITAGFMNASGASQVSVTQLPSTLYLFGGNGQEGRALQPLPLPLVVRVLDEAGSPVAGASVTFTANNGGSVSAPIALANQLGEASTYWTLGEVIGQQFLQAAVGAAATTFSANALPPLPARPDTVIKASADASCVTLGDSVAPSPTVLVKDQYGRPFPGAGVTFWLPDAGNAVVRSTDDRGIAVSSAWVPSVAGHHSLSVDVAGEGIGGNPISFSATVRRVRDPSSGRCRRLMPAASRLRAVGW